MKVVRNTPDQLILSYVPWKTGIFAIAAVLLFLAYAFHHFNLGWGHFWDALPGMLIIIVVLAIIFAGRLQRIQIILDRANDSFVLRRRSWVGYRAKTLKLSDFRCSDMQERRSSKNETLYRPVLYFVHVDGTSVIPLFTSYTNWSGDMHRAMDLLNEWHKANVVDSDSQSA